MTHPTAGRFETRDKWVLAATVFAVALLARLPRVLSPFLVLDGDEAVVGLMAKHLGDLRELPVFFYGQGYGFSGLEAAVGAIAFKLFGVNDWSLAFAMATLWSAGAAFFALAARALIGSTRAGLVAGLVFAVTPAWMFWSVKARGGYITAATFASIALYLLVTGRHRTWRHGVLVGLIGGVVAQAQPLWGLGLAPFFVWAWWRGRWWQPAWWALGAAIVIVPLWWASQGATDFWRPVVFGGGFNLDHFAALPRHVFDHLNGKFYLAKVFPATWPVRAASAVLIVLAVLATVQALIRGVIRRDVVSLLLVIALAGTLVSAVFLANIVGRYLLPVAAWIVLLVAYEARHWNRTWAYRAFTALLLFAGVVSSFDSWRSFPGDRYPKGVIRRTVDHLEKGNVSVAFVTEPLLQWQVMFYSRETVVCRFLNTKDRYPPYVVRADEALAGGERCALLGFMWQKEPWKAQGIDPDVVDGMLIEWPFAIHFGVTRRQLAKIGFAF